MPLPTCFEHFCHGAFGRFGPKIATLRASHRLAPHEPSATIRGSSDISLTCLGHPQRFLGAEVVSTELRIRPPHESSRPREKGQHVPVNTQSQKRSTVAYFGSSGAAGQRLLNNR